MLCAGFKLSCIHVLDIRGADAEKTSLVKEVMEQAMLQSSTLSSLPEQLANVVRACGTAVCPLSSKVLFSLLHTRGML